MTEYALAKTGYYPSDIPQYSYSLDILCSSKLTVYFELRSRKLLASRNRSCPRTNILAYFCPKWRLLLIFNIHLNGDVISRQDLDDRTSNIKGEVKSHHICYPVTICRLSRMTRGKSSLLQTREMKCGWHNKRSLSHGK